MQQNATQQRMCDEIGVNLVIRNFLGNNLLFESVEVVQYMAVKLKFGATKLKIKSMHQSIHAEMFSGRGGSGSPFVRG